MPSEEVAEPYDMDPQVFNLDTETHNSTEDLYNYIEESRKFQIFFSQNCMMF